MVLGCLAALATSITGSTSKAFALPTVIISATGDWGCTGNTIATINNIMNQKPNLVLGLGDYSYEDTPNCWLDALRPIASITRINFGNHEVENPILLTSYLKNFSLSRQYYSYNIGNVHILTISTDDTISIGSPQYNFVVNDLEVADSNPNLKWIIVSLHEPFYSSPNTCGDSGCSGNKIFRDLLHPLFDKHDVDLVLEGHVHNYERSYPITFNAQDSSKPIITSCNKNTYDNPNGQIYSIVGTGGVNLHGLSDKAQFIASQQDSKFGILNIQITDTKLHATFVSNDGPSMDQFTITKTAGKLISNTIPPEESKICPGSSPPTSAKNNRISSIVILEDDESGGGVKVDIQTPKIREQIRDKVDKKIQEIKEKVEQKHLEINAKARAAIIGDNSDARSGKDNNELLQKGQKTKDNYFEELKERYKERLKTRLFD
ncbi:MAG TPA: metallophosphoesterase [Nitrososphaeraceae archaeon]